jgi:hypothetical protein
MTGRFKMISNRSKKICTNSAELTTTEEYILLRVEGKAVD